MNIEEQDANKEKNPKTDYKMNIDQKEIFLAKVFRCAFKLMDRSQRMPLSHIMTTKTKPKKIKTKIKRGS